MAYTETLVITFLGNSLKKTDIYETRQLLNVFIFILRVKSSLKEYKMKTWCFTLMLVKCLRNGNSQLYLLTLDFAMNILSILKEELDTKIH